MPLPVTIQSQVDPAAVTKVTRLFNNTLGDVLSELVQNARRAGASAVDLDVSEAESMAYLSISDDGAGIEDPSVIVALGRSGWDDETRRREDPAGMGVFSLAGRDVEIRSCSRASGQGWRIEIARDAWESGSPIAVIPCAHPFGTRLRVALDEQWAKALDNAARAAARYCPMPIRLNGTVLPQEDWLAGAVAVVEEGGVRIGLFADNRASRFSPSINFHGLTVACALPSIPEKNRHWSARVDIVDAPDLQLVLPARKEMVENPALARLRIAIRGAIYRHIQSLGAHRLPFEQWREAADLGIELPEARPELLAWVPATADYNSRPSADGLLSAAELVLVDDFGAPLEQCANFALSNDGRFEGRLAKPDETMAGYGWYNRLPRITNLRFEIERDGETLTYDTSELPGLESGPVDRLDLILEISGSLSETVVIPAPVAIEYDEGLFCSFEEASILLASKDAVTPSELVDLLEGACFCSSDDREADSWDTQNSRFLLDAQEMATRLLLGDDAALIERLRAILSYRAQWFVPEGRQFTAIIGRAALDIRIDTVPAN
ncbi:ATP-binding protein [Sphingomonas sp.]|uniref:ATP-binding protein n=1 Tax=Sphingomonas sp. TaxID=28214 RepID=UPI00307FBF64